MALLRLALSAVLIGLSYSPALAQDSSIRLAPATEWSLDYADQFCALRRSFGEGEQRTFLELRRSYPTGGFTVFIISEGLQRGAMEPRTRFEPDEGSSTAAFSFALSRDSRTIGARFGDSLETSIVRTQARQRGADSGNGGTISEPERDAREREVNAYFVADVFTQDITLLTGEMHGPMEALRACVDDLVRGLGVDTTVQSSLSREPEPSSYIRLFRVLDRTGVMTGNQTVASAQLRLVIGATGEVENCYLPDVAADAERHERACAAILELDFEPALDAAGNPVRAMLATVLSRVAASGGGYVR